MYINLKNFSSDHFTTGHVCLEILTQGRSPPLSVKISLFDAFKQLLTLHKLTPTSDATSLLKMSELISNAIKWRILSSLAKVFSTDNLCKHFSSGPVTFHACNSFAHRRETTGTSCASAHMTMGRD